MIPIRKTLLLPRSCSMNNMTPGPSPMTSVFLNLRAQLTSAALSLTKSCSHLTGRNTLLEPPALSLDGEPPLRVAALPSCVPHSFSSPPLPPESSFPLAQL